MRSIASTLRNEEGAFDGDIVGSPNSPTTRRKKRRRGTAPDFRFPKTGATGEGRLWPTHMR